MQQNNTAEVSSAFKPRNKRTCLSGSAPVCEWTRSWTCPYLYATLVHTCVESDLRFCNAGGQSLVGAGAYGPIWGPFWKFVSGAGEFLNFSLASHYIDIRLFVLFFFLILVSLSFNYYSILYLQFKLLNYANLHLYYLTIDTFHYSFYIYNLNY